MLMRSLRLQGYIGTFAVQTEDKKNVIGISLFKSSLSGGMGLKRGIFPPHYYALDWFITLWMAFWLLLPFYLVLSFGEELSSLAKIGIFFLLSWPLLWAYQKVNGLIQGFSGFKLRGRYIAPFYKMERGELYKQMFAFLIERMNKVSSDNNIDLIMCNIDSNDNLFATKGRKFGPRPPLFMGKYVQGKGESGRTVNCNTESKILFFDPRDM